MTTSDTRCLFQFAGLYVRTLWTAETLKYVHDAQSVFRIPRQNQRVLKDWRHSTWPVRFRSSRTRSRWASWHTLCREQVTGTRTAPSSGSLAWHEQVTSWIRFFFCCCFLSTGSYLRNLAFLTTKSARILMRILVSCHSPACKQLIGVHLVSVSRWKRVLVKYWHSAEPDRDHQHGAADEGARLLHESRQRRRGDKLRAHAASGTQRLGRSHGHHEMVADSAKRHGQMVRHAG